MNRGPIKRTRFAVALAVAIVLLTVPAIAVSFAETTSSTTSITLFVPKTAGFGDVARLSARVVDATGAPISGAKVTFVLPETFFLGATSDVQIGEAQTNKDGVAETEFQVRNAGWVAVRADFRGSDRYAASRATGRFLVEGLPRQLYTEHAGVQIPGLTGSPLQLGHGEGGTGEAVQAPTGLSALWPMLSVWPLALTLLIVWSLYGAAVFQMFRIASSSGDLAIASAWRHGSRRAVAGGAGGEWGARRLSRSGAKQRRGPMKNTFVLPIVAVIVVVVAPITLISVALFGPYTHANLTPFFDSRYTRSEQIEVGAPLLYQAAGLAHQGDATAPIEERGKALLVARGCGACHGINGLGGAVAPRLIPDIEVLRDYVRVGPRGMPVFAPQEVTDYDLAAITAYLKSVSK